MNANFLFTFSNLDIMDFNPKGSLVLAMIHAHIVLFFAA